MWVQRKTDPGESVPDVALVTCHAPVGDRCLGTVLGGDDQFFYITTVHVVVEGQAVHLLCTSEKEIFFKSVRGNVLSSMQNGINLGIHVYKL